MNRLCAIIFVLLFSTSALAATETFYVCNGGNGTLPETATCATAWDISDINNSANYDTDDQDDGKIGQNDDIVLMDDGGNFTSQINPPDFSGTSGKPISIKVQAGDSVTITGGDSIPSSTSSQGLIHLDGNNDYWTIDATDGTLLITASGYYGIGCKATSGNHIESPTVKGVTIEGTYRHGMAFSWADNFTAQDNDIEHGNEIRRDSCSIGGASFLVEYSNTGTVTGNEVHEGYGEGMNITDQSTNITFSGNFIWSHRSAHIYLDRGNSSNTVTNNLIVCTDDPAFFQDNGAYPVCANRAARGISINNEDCTSVVDDCRSNSNVIVGNIVIGCARGLLISNTCNPDCTAPGGDASVANNVFYNNSLIDNLVNIQLGNDHNSAISNNVIKNNVSLTYNAACVNVDDYVDPTGKIDCTYNLWDGALEEADEEWSDGNDRAANGYDTYKTLGWRDISSGDSFDVAWLAVQEGSAIVGNADSSIGAAYDDRIASIDLTTLIAITTGDQDDYGPPDAPTLTAEPDDAPLNPTLELTHNTATGSGESWDLGAVLASNTHSFTTWQMICETDDGDNDGDCSDEEATFASPTWSSKSYTDLVSHTFSGLVNSKTYCWRAATGNVAGQGDYPSAANYDMFTTLAAGGGGGTGKIQIGTSGGSITVGTSGGSITVHP